jgi:endoglucanase
MTDTTQWPSRRHILAGFAGLAGAASTATWTSRTAAATGLRYAGVNLSGGEFGPIPGKINKDYVYPERDQLETFAKLGFNLVRIPFRWERIQPAARGALSIDELSRLTKVVGDCDKLKLSCILDLHNFARRKIADDSWQAEYLIGSKQVSPDDFSDVWARLAPEFASSENVIFGLMNEPFGLSAGAWLQLCNDAIKAIRAQHANNLILVPGVAYTGAHSWTASGNEVLAGVKDPANNFAIEVHQYFDADSSGTSPAAVSAKIGSKRIAAFEAWARKTGVKAFLGEFASGSSPESIEALDDLLTTMTKHNDVWLGWAAWAAGTWWPDDYMFKLDPKKNGQLPDQTRVLSEHAKRLTAS